MLDADNRLRPPALTRLLEALESSGAAFAYSQLRLFGDASGVGVADVWDPARLRKGNYIDAMALVRRQALLDVGGYAVLADDHGWEDYDLWCRFAAAGIKGVFLPEALCDYRVHGNSMLRTPDQSIFRRVDGGNGPAPSFPVQQAGQSGCQATGCAMLSPDSITP